MAEKSKKIVQIEIETNAGKATKEFEQLSNGVLKAADSAEKLDASFDDVYNGMAPLTTRMGEAEDRLYELALAGDTASKEYQELLTKVGEYRKVQIQTDLAVDGAATTMTQKLGSALNGATSGFAATQGAMALFGDENQALEQSLLKVQSALAIQQGVQGLTEAYRELSIGTKIAGAAQYVYTTAVGTSTGAMKLFRLALIGTGIGAIVVGLGLLIANFDKVKKAVTNAISSFDKLGPAMKIILFPITSILEGFKLMKKGLVAFGIIASDEEKASLAREDAKISRAEKRIKEIDEEIEAINRRISVREKEEGVIDKIYNLKRKQAKDINDLNKVEVDARTNALASIEKREREVVEKVTASRDKLANALIAQDARINKLRISGAAISKKTLDAQAAGYKTLAEITQNIETGNLLALQELNIERQNLEIDYTETIKANNKKRADSYKQYAAERLSIARQIEDLENSLLQDGIEKEHEINRDKFRKLREDVKGNREERKILTDLYNQQEAQAEAKIIADNQKRREDAFETERSERVELLNFVDELNTKEVESEKAKNLAILDNAVETNEKLIESDKAVAEAKKNIQDAQIANVEAGISLFKDLAGENKKLQALSIAAESAVSIAKTIISTQAANAAATAQGTALAIASGGASVAAAAGLVTQNNISAGISIAAQIAAAAKGISALGGGASAASGNAPSDTGGGGAVPNFNVVGDSSINQIAALQSTPVQAFVVSGEVTTSQALDRNRVQNATL